MSTMSAKVQARAEQIDMQRPLPCVFYTLGGDECGSWVPSGSSRAQTVANAVGRLMGCVAHADEAPIYDTGTRSWTLLVSLFDRRGRRVEVVQVPMRWSADAAPAAMRWH
jgi:hypothetical protein